MTPPVPDPWRVERRRGSVAALHGAGWPAPLVPTVWVLEPVDRALVLGSTQRALAERLASAPDGPTVVVRRSGGGAVLVEPGATVWIDLFLPRDDPRWVDDVGRSAVWLGEAWVRALASLDVAAQVDPGPFRPGPWGSLVCFAGVAGGEVLAPAGGKLVGISQRRTRHGARFQCMAHTAHDPDALVEALRPGMAGASAGASAEVSTDGLRSAVAEAVAVVPAPPARLEAAVLAALGAGHTAT